MAQRPNIRTLVGAARAELEVARTDDRLIPSAKANCTKVLPRLDRVLKVLDRDNPLVYMVLDAYRAVSWELQFLAEPKTKNGLDPVRLVHVTALRAAICDLRVSDLEAMFPLAGAEKE